MRFEQTQAKPAEINVGAELADEDKLVFLRETISDIDEALQAEDFYRQDRNEVLRNREFFEEKYRSLVKVGGSAINSAENI